MADAAAVEWIELYQLMVERYPELPHHQAHVELLRDAFIRFPKEVATIITPALPHLAERFPQIIEAVGITTGKPAIVLAGLIAGITREGWRAASQTIPVNTNPVNTNQAQTIASELKTFNNPNLVGQIANINALITSNAAVYYIKKMADQAERIANGLELIGDHIRSKNIRGDRFPGHVHSYVKSMIEKHREESVPHYFFIFNQGTEWQPKFDDINRTDPLGPHYLGYSHDLDELVDFLIGTARPRLGPEAIFHILIPVVSQLAITESLTFPDEMRPFRVSGQLGESGLPCVYLCMPLQEDRANFQHIGSLRPRPRWVLLQQAGLCLPILGQWLSTSLKPVYFDDPNFAIPTTVGTPLYCSLYTECEPVPPRTLGTRRTT